MTRTVIVGPSCAGKSTYAWGNRDDEDLVVDFDRIAAAFGNVHPHASSGLIGEATFKARFAAISAALESDESSWIIHSKPSTEQIAEYIDVGARFVVLDPGLDECLARAEAEERPDGTEANIRDWYDDPPTFPSEADVTTITDTTARGARMTTKRMNRYWGDHALPTNKAEFFNAITMPAPTGTGRVATIRINGPIDSWGGYWGVSSLDVAEVLDGLGADVKQIILRINSGGGDVFEALTIMNQLKAHAARVTAVVDGLAASAASFIAAGCDEVVMSPGSEMMIHLPSSFEWGDAHAMRKTADRLDTITESIIEIYEAKAGEKNWVQLLEAETWLTSAEAVNLGLADRVAEIPDAGETESLGIDTPDAIEPTGTETQNAAPDTGTRTAPHLRAAATERPVSPEPGNSNRKESIVQHDAFVAGIRERLGMTDATATDETVLAALDEALEEAADTTPTNPTEHLPEGTVVMDAAQHAQLVADAAAGREAREEQIRARRDEIVNTAIREGRIAPASRDQWRTALDNDEQNITNLLGSFPKSTAVAVNELGRSDEIHDADNALYNAFARDTEGA